MDLANVFISAKERLAKVFRCIQTLAEVLISANWRLAKVFRCIDNLVEMFIRVKWKLAEVCFVTVTTNEFYKVVRALMRGFASDLSSPKIQRW